MATSSTTITGINSIDSLLAGTSWTGTAATATTITYSFMSSGADGETGFQAMTPTQQQAVAAALATWSAVANVTFVAVASGGDIQFGTSNQGVTSSGVTYTGWVNSKGSPLGVLDYADVYLNNAQNYQGAGSAQNAVFTPGTYGPQVLIHEIGHALGLKHPGNYNAGSSSGAAGPYLPSATDNYNYTDMSYHAGTASLYDTTPMLYDIQAIQYLYGANTSYHAGNDTYGFSNTTAPLSIWDGGGTNSFDFSACTGAVTINLNAGTFSSTGNNAAGAAQNNVSIAYGTVIQNAIAGSGGSTIICNSANDTVTGGDGNDFVIIGSGTDTIDGRGGSNTIQLTKTITDISKDSITNIQTIDLAKQTPTMTVEQFAAFQTALNATGSVIFADAGTITAKSVFNTYQLAAGNNDFTAASLASGAYKITGGSGNDNFHFQNSQITDATTVQAGAGQDSLVLSGETALKLTTANHLTGLEAITVGTTGADVSIALAAGFDGGTVSAVSIDISAEKTGAITFDASKVTDGTSFTVTAGGSGTAKLTGGAGADHLSGNAGNDLLIGGGGDDQLTGAGANGRTVAVYSGASSEYTITENSDGTATVTDNKSGRDGSDHLAGVTLIQFSDTLLALSNSDSASLSNFVAQQNTVRNATNGAVAAMAPGTGSPGGHNVAGWQTTAFSGTDNAVVLDGPRSQYVLHVDGTGATAIKDIMSMNVISVTGASYLVFTGDAADYSKLSSSVMFIATGDDANIARIYDAVFGRLPDLPGLEAWQAQLDSGAMSMNQIAQAFVTSGEFTTKYGAHLTGQQFVDALYTDVLGRTADKSGETAWVNYLATLTDDTGATAAQATVLYDFAASAEEISHSSSWLVDPATGGYADHMFAMDAATVLNQSLASHHLNTRLIDTSTIGDGVTAGGIIIAPSNGDETVVITAKAAPETVILSGIRAVIVENAGSTIQDGSSVGEITILGGSQTTVILGTSWNDKVHVLGGTDTTIRGFVSGTDEIIVTTAAQAADVTLTDGSATPVSGASQTFAAATGLVVKIGNIGDGSVASVTNAISRSYLVGDNAYEHVTFIGQTSGGNSEIWFFGNPAATGTDLEASADTNGNHKVDAGEIVHLATLVGVVPSAIAAADLV